VARQILLVVGIALLSFGGIGIVVGLVWLTACHIQGTIPYVLSDRLKMLIFTLPALLLVIAIVGAAFVAGALATPRKSEPRVRRTFQPYPHLHG
jgi:ABC-type sulfate transport system permease subunit